MPPQNNNPTLAQRTPPADFIPDTEGAAAGGAADFIPDKPSEADAVAALPNAANQAKSQLMDRIQPKADRPGTLDYSVKHGYREPAEEPESQVEGGKIGGYMGMAGGVGGGARVIAERGLRAAAGPIIKGVTGAVAGSAAGGYGGRQIGTAVGGKEGGDTGAQIGATLGSLGGGMYGSMGLNEPVPEPEFSPVAKSSGPYRGPGPVAAQQKLSARVAARQPQQPPASATMTAPGAVSAAPTATTAPTPPVSQGPSSSGMPPGMPPPGPQMPLAQRIGGGAAQMPGRRIILPGEEIDPMARENAGSAAQAKEGDLRRLAAAGDRSAAVELTRRRLPQGPTDYSKAPLPKGSDQGALVERVPPPDQPNLTQRTGAPTEQRITPGQSPTGTERRADWWKDTATMQPTEGETLAGRIRQSSAAPANANEGLAMRQIMQDPDTYARYKAADPATQRSMMITARDSIGAPNRALQQQVRQRSSKMRSGGIHK